MCVFAFWFVRNFVFGSFGSVGSFWFVYILSLSTFFFIQFFSFLHNL